MQVLCIKNCERPIYLDLGDEAIKGEIYTVRGITEVDYLGNTGYLFEEIRTGNTLRSGEECGYVTSHFRPITDISSLTDIDKKVFSKNKETVR